MTSLGSQSHGPHTLPEVYLLCSWCPRLQPGTATRKCYTRWTGQEGLLLLQEP